MTPSRTTVKPGDLVWIWSASQCDWILVLVVEADVRLEFPNEINLKLLYNNELIAHGPDRQFYMCSQDNMEQ